MSQMVVPEVVAQEDELLGRVKRALALRREEPQRMDYRAEMAQLREDLGEARLVEDKASILEQMARISHLSRQQSQSQRGHVDPQNPYFGHLSLEDEDGERREILIGKHTFISGSVQIADWRDAPISQVFYQSREGEDFCIPVAGSTLEGEVLARRTVTISEGELRRVGTERGSFVRGQEGWEEVGGQGPALRGGQGKALRPERSHRKDKHLPEIAALLDQEQFALITRPDAGLVVIQGSAGSGKTTVALHRVAYLAFQDARRYTQNKTVVIVYNLALARYISQVLPSLGVEGVEVLTLSDWAREQRSKALPRMPDRYSDATPGVVTRAKLHAAMLPMWDEVAQAAQGQKVQRVFDDAVTSYDWWRQGLARHAPGEFSDAEVEEIHQWCAHLHALRDGDADKDNPACLDVEDDILLLRLFMLLNGGLPGPKGRPLRYEHLVVDEAQDFSPVELSVLLETVRENAPVTLAGDTAQKIVQGNDFQDWTYVLGRLGRSHVEVSPLKISYRSTAQIMRAALDVLGPLAPEEPPMATHEGQPVELFHFPGDGEAWAFLADQLRDLLYEEPNASVAVLARHPDQAKAAHEALTRAHLTGVRYVEDQDFSFQPGIEVTEIHQTKGLEFDYVVVVDVDAPTFPRQDSARHLLHVAMTRAAYQCWLVASDTPSPLLPDWLEVRRS